MKRVIEKRTVGSRNLEEGPPRFISNTLAWHHPDVTVRGRSSSDACTRASFSACTHRPSLCPGSDIGYSEAIGPARLWGSPRCGIPRVHSRRVRSVDYPVRRARAARRWRQGSSSPPRIRAIRSRSSIGRSPSWIENSPESTSARSSLRIA